MDKFGVVKLVQLKNETTIFLILILTGQTINYSSSNNVVRV
jgi:hypothetical protein